MSAVLLTATAEGERLALVATGSWTAERAAELEKIIDETARPFSERSALVLPVMHSIVLTGTLTPGRLAAALANWPASAARRR